MNPIILFLSTLLITGNMVLFDFSENSDLSNWMIVDDVVMGGRSDGNLSINAEGHGLFEGTVSLENNGGFSSARYNFDQKNINNFKTAKIRLKGDGKQYQFRVKSDRNDRHSYVHNFQTSGDWEEIEIPLQKMKPTFRGMALNIPDFPGQLLEEIAFLIGNKKAEPFKLEIDRIVLAK